MMVSLPTDIKSNPRTHCLLGRLSLHLIVSEVGVYVKIRSIPAHGDNGLESVTMWPSWSDHVYLALPFLPIVSAWSSSVTLVMDHLHTHTSLSHVCKLICLACLHLHSAHRALLISHESVPSHSFSPLPCWWAGDVHIYLACSVLLAPDLPLFAN